MAFSRCFRKNLRLRCLTGFRVKLSMDSYFLKARNKNIRLVIIEIFEISAEI